MSDIINCQYCNKPRPSSVKVCPYCKPTSAQLLKNEINRTAETVSNTVDKIKNNPEFKKREQISATKTCPKCAMDVPAKAEICPYCRKRIKTSSTTKIIAAIFGFIFIIGSITQCLFTGKTQQKALNIDHAAAIAIAPEACNFMIDAGLATSGYKTIEGLEEYYCTSQPRKLGEGYPLSNTISYHVTGDPKNVKKVYLMLNVNQQEQAQVAYESLLSDAEFLTKKALNTTMPNMTKKSIKEGVTGQWKIDEATVKIIRSDWPTGKGHDIKYIIECNSWPLLQKTVPSNPPTVESTPSTSVYSLEPFIATIADGQERRNLNIKIELEMASPVVKSEIEASIKQIRGSIQNLLNGKNLQDIQDVQGKNALKDEILGSINKSIPPSKIVKVYFSDFNVR